MKLSNRDFLFLMQTLSDSLNLSSNEGFLFDREFRIQQFNEILTKQSTKDIELDEEPE